MIKTDKGFKIDSRQTTSGLANALLLDKVVKLSEHVTGDLLDVGAGDSPFLPVFRSSIRSYTSVDLLGSLHGLRPSVCAAADALPFKADSFDSVSCTEVLEHCPFPEKAVRELQRVLKPCGHTIISAPFMYCLHMDPEDYFRFTRAGLRRMATANGLDVVKIENVGGTVDFAMDFYSKLVILTLSAVSYLAPRLFKKYGLPFRILQRIFAVYPQLLYLFLRKIDFKDELYTLGYVMLAQKNGAH